MFRQKTVIHILDLASRRLSGVVRSLVSCQSYRQQTGRTLIIGLADANSRCWFDPGNPTGNQVLYSSGEPRFADQRYRTRFLELERKFGARFVYGLAGPAGLTPADQRPAEFILIDPASVNIHPVNALKGWLYEEFGIESARYEWDNDYERMVRLAPAALGAIRALVEPTAANPPIIVSHDVIGLPTALAAVLDPLCSFKTLYCAHHVPMVRQIVEGHPGHDLMYNKLCRWAREHDYYLNDLFGLRDTGHDYALIGAARYCDNIVAMSRRIKEALHFLNPHLKDIRIDLMYNGVEGAPVTFEQKRQARQAVRQMVQQRLGFTPDFVVIRRDHLDTANAIWRDFRVLAALNQELYDTGKTAVYLLAPPGAAGFGGPGGGPESPALHRYWQEWFAQFNAHNTQIKILFIQPGPADGTVPSSGEVLLAGDIELAQNIYRPSCVRPLQTVAAGGLCVCSDSCGLNGLLADMAGRSRTAMNRLGAHRFSALDLVIRADYTATPAIADDRNAIMGLNQLQRDQIEDQVARQVAQIIRERLPRNEADLAERLRLGGELIESMNWNTLCMLYFLPALDYAYTHHHFRSIA